MPAWGCLEVVEDHVGFGQVLFHFADLATHPVRLEIDCRTGVHHHPVDWLAINIALEV